MVSGISDFDDAAWSAAYGVATGEQLALLATDTDAWQRALERLVAHVDAHAGDDGLLKGIRSHLAAALERLPAFAATAEAALAGPRLQATWDAGRLVVWAGGPEHPPEDFDALSDRLEAVGAPPHGWQPHRSVPLPDGSKADALAIGLSDVLGWLAAVAGAGTAPAVAPSLRWIARVAVVGVQAVASGQVVPLLQAAKQADGRRRGFGVAWRPAVVDDDEVRRLARTMPGAVGALHAGLGAKVVVLAILDRVVDVVTAEAAGQFELPATPPRIKSDADMTEAVIASLGGGTFDAPAAVGSRAASRLRGWTEPVAGVRRRRLIVQLGAPKGDTVWPLSVLVFGPDRQPRPRREVTLDAEGRADFARLERLLPVLARARNRESGEVALTGAEAWDFMTETGATLRAAGFDVRVPAFSRRSPAPALRLATEPSGPPAAGAAQLSNVRWSVVFGDVELTAREIASLAKQARPLVRSRGEWVELDRADLDAAAAALAESEKTATLTGAEILRQAVGLDGHLLAGGVQIVGESWATAVLDKAEQATLTPVTTVPGFRGELRHYQADALSWLRFLETVGLGGCLALDMGLGKTPTLLAQLAADRQGPALVVAPAAVVGNWAAEAAKFTPELSVAVHHGSSRAEGDALGTMLSQTDLVITTYATAVRDIESLVATEWDHLILDEAQAVKNPVSETARQLRRIPARTRLALTGTPIENGVGDLWAILDFVNPALLGSRASFVEQLSGDEEGALRALNGVLVFRRTKAEPEVAGELPDKIDELDHCTMTAEQIGLYQAVLDDLTATADSDDRTAKKGAVLAAITRLKQICDHPVAFLRDGSDLGGRSGKLNRLEEIVESVFAAGERLLVFTHFAEWGTLMAEHLSAVTEVPIACYHGGLARGVRDRMVRDFQAGRGPGALVLSLKAGGAGLNLTAANHVVLYDRWWNPAAEDQARDRAWRIGQTRTVISHRLVCPGTVDERVEEVVEGKRHIAGMVLPKSSSLADLGADQLRTALGLDTAGLLTEDSP